MQKHAYDVRCSDLSSDVCSSDLAEQEAVDRLLSEDVVDAATGLVGLAEVPLDGALPVVGELRGEGVVEAVALGDLLDPDGVRGPVPTAGDEVGRVAGEDEEQEEEEGEREEDRDRKSTRLNSSH